jgi:hypothetical protein
MSTGEHYFIQQAENRQHAVRPRDSERASAIFGTQYGAIQHTHKLNPTDRPDVGEFGMA